MNKKCFFLMMFIVIFLLSFVFNKMCFADQTIIAKKAKNVPVIDGISSDAIWKESEAIVTHDNIADIDVTLRAVYKDNKIYFLVSYPDLDISDTHKTWVWNKNDNIYTTGNDREDVFVFKWNMEDHPVDLSLKNDSSYKADIWFWKACRTNPIGYADDKYQYFSTKKISKKSYKILLDNGKKMYLMRRGDEGKSAYKNNLPIKYTGKKTARFANRIPTSSRGDIKAKGSWSDGRWNIEFERDLDTGNDDDIKFEISKTYLFGISRYEIAGRSINPKLSQPLYGSGDVSEVLILKLEE